MPQYFTYNQQEVIAKFGNKNALYLMLCGR